MKKTDGVFNINAPNPSDFAEAGSMKVTRASFLTRYGAKSFYTNPSEMTFDPILTRYLWLDLDNLADVGGGRCVILAGLKAYS